MVGDAVAVRSTPLRSSLLAVFLSGTGAVATRNVGGGIVRAVRAELRESEAVLTRLTFALRKFGRLRRGVVNYRLKTTTFSP